MSSRRALLLALALTLPVHAGANPNLLDFELKSLQAPETHDLERYEGSPVLMVFFKPDCSWCFRQVKAFNTFMESCDIAPIAVGVNGDRSALKKALRRLRPDFPAYQASADLLASLGEVPATPFTLVSRPSGEFATWLRGYVPLEQLSKELTEVGIHCG